MLDIQFIRDNTELVKEKAKQKGYEVDVDRLLELDRERRDLIQTVDGLRQQRNELSDSLKKGQPSEDDINRGKQLKVELAAREKYLDETEAELSKLLKQVPNMPTEDTPVGSSEAENKVEYEWGDRPQFDFEAKNHWEIGEARGWIDKERAGKVAGSRFTYIKGDLVKLQLALEAWIIDTLTDEAKLKEIIEQFELKDISSKPFTPVLPPLMIRTELFDAMDRLEPREDRYKIEGEELWLQGSAEHVLGSMHAGEVFSQADLPVRYLGFATSFRKEAGSYGKDMEGLIRLHQFDKLEMESFSTSEQSLGEHLFFIAIQEYLMRSLGLPYRKLLKCTFDIGKPNARGVDLEVWLPGQGKYRETHTADYMTDYQARRLATKYRTAGGELALVHTNDATALALSRGPVAIIENYQTKEGKIRVPEVLRQYIGGREVL